MFAKLGYALVMVELFELGAHKAADEWIYVVTGSWLMFSPLVLRIQDAAAATNAMVVGSLMAAYAIASMAGDLSAQWHDDRAPGS